jgi:hypothetical protein
MSSNLSGFPTPDHVLPLYISGTTPVTLAKNTYTAVIQTDVNTITVNLPPLSGTLIGEKILFSANPGGGQINIVPNGLNTINRSTSTFPVVAGAVTLVASPDAITNGDWEVSSTSLGLGGINYVIIDTRNGPVTQTLADGITGQTTIVTLLTKDGFPAIVQTNRGSFYLTSDKSSKILYFENNVWKGLDDTDSNASFTTTQYGTKLTATGELGAGFFGAAVALSDDGNTLAVGATSDGTTQGGAVYIFTRASATGSAWSQQAKLNGTGFTGTDTTFGYAVALSADGKTLAVGAPADNGSVGATWVFTLVGSVWTQQGAKLIGTGATGSAEQGTSVALSADGNNLVIGGPTDNTNIGALWVFTRAGGVWTQQGTKLTGTGETGAGELGFSVAMSADGNTLVSGAPMDNTSTGAIFVFTRTAGAWTQLSTKITLTGETGAGAFGSSVAITPDGLNIIAGAPNDNTNVGKVGRFEYNNIPAGIAYIQVGVSLTASGETGTGQFGNAVSVSGAVSTLIVGAKNDNTNVGATFVYCRVGNVYTKTTFYYNQLEKLIGTGATGTANQGYSVAINATGNTLAVGGPDDNGSIGAVWIFD